MTVLGSKEGEACPARQRRLRLIGTDTLVVQGGGSRHDPATSASSPIDQV